MDAQSGTLGGPSRTAISSLIERSVFRANLHRLHAGFRLGPGLEHAVIDDGRCGGRLFVDDGALFCSCIPHDIVFARDSRLRKSRRGGESDDGARKQKFLHPRFLRLIYHLRKRERLPLVPDSARVDFTIRSISGFDMPPHVAESRNSSSGKSPRSNCDLPSFPVAMPFVEFARCHADLLPAANHA